MKTIRVSLTLPEPDYRRLERYAAAQGLLTLSGAARLILDSVPLDADDIASYDDYNTSRTVRTGIMLRDRQQEQIQAWSDATGIHPASTLRAAVALGAAKGLSALQAS